MALRSPDGTSIDVWILPSTRARIDGIGRPIAEPATRALQEVVGRARCGTASHCRVVRARDRRMSCARCGRTWSAASVAAGAVVARSTMRCGVDIEDSRVRPAAFRSASSWCGVEVTTTRQWTQAEALWKASVATGRPEPSSILIPACSTEGWQLSRDGRHAIYSATAPADIVWSLAVVREP